MATNDDVAERLASLPHLTKEQLLRLWGELFRSKAPAGLRKEVLTRFLAHRIQEEAFGALNGPTSRRLQEFERALRKDPKATLAPDRTLLRPGTRLIREWRGETHIVTAAAEGYSYRGATYTSLSAIARAITGSRWSGPLFFGLKGSVPAGRQTS